MKIKKIQLINFKRFDDLTIDLGNMPKKIIALVGPNGSGKSSVFDAFEEKLKNYKGTHQQEHASFFAKLYFSIFPEKKSESYNKENSIKIENDNNNEFNKKSFYIRTAYRFTSRLQVDNLRKLPDVIDDVNRPYSSNAMDNRLQENYERMLSKAFQEFFNDTSGKTGLVTRKELIDKINNILGNILDIKISNIGDVTQGKGQLFFEKESSKDFPFENLSSGEKEVVDIIIDLIIKTPEYDNTVYAIDEPELHLNTSIQRKLLIEIEKLIPDNCQIWVATHSVGFLRSLQEELKEKSQIIDFSEKDCFNGTQTAYPIKTTRQNWQRIFQTALEDLTGLVAPEVIIYCEGRPDPTNSGGEQGLDASIYNLIFGETNHNTLFVSSGGNDVIANSTLALKIITKAFTKVKLFLLKDRDDLTEQERIDFLGASSSNKMLERREIENYVFDYEILNAYAVSISNNINKTDYDKIVTDIENQDLKLGTTMVDLQKLVNGKGSLESFKIELSKFIIPTTEVYKRLYTVIF
ncbi:MAG: ATP-binding protein [Candidatus Pacebacteria bacterium]|nr:ATP-binding protein [Candidatus Paceibacterota bacterium]MCF7862774.1 ATP-binding protein [Candidatus Paceibacterota bacterium]